ncbi:hypothetical protein [Halorussus salinus]|uniref:hypothetical protein n=1 Tax=Halorussus salinus TaxID=1364935 RepID=UPI0010918890|nr:hypothetical protein [Halorussus salinus]
MFPSFDTLRETWADSTDFDSARRKFAVLCLTAVFGWVVSWELSALWEALFGYSSFVTVTSTAVAFCGLYGVFGYAETAFGSRERP